MDSAKVLGVYIDDNLTWKDHISNVCKKAAMCIAILNKVIYIYQLQSICKLYIVY